MRPRLEHDGDGLVFDPKPNQNISALSLQDTLNPDSTVNVILSKVLFDGAIITGGGGFRQYLSRGMTKTMHLFFLMLNVFYLTVVKSSMRVITPNAISRRSAGVSGHGYNVARNLIR